MASRLIFPKNRDVLDVRSTGLADQWLKFFNKVYDRLNASAELTAVAATDAIAAPATYSQAHIQSLVVEVNETKARLNTLLTTLQK